MNYTIKIKIFGEGIICNAGPLELSVFETKRGIKNLYRYLCGKFGEDRVSVWEKKSTPVHYDIIYGRMA